ncbi:tyrosine--tRNA ligase, partial [Candidatus Woesearchaeota archaeon]|nr:tyrosine--tRNA ligase [Candidatus Woesearchaeota archaeon]
MDIEERIRLIMEVGEEILTEQELRQLLETKQRPVAYDGFEPSGNLHIAQGILRAINVNKMVNAGVNFKMWVADWFGWMNNKLGGDLEKIRVSGEYMIEVWKACGMKTEQIQFLWAKDVMADEEYWKKVIQIGRSSTVQRIVRCSQIMGRSESDQLSAAQIFYPCMQCADIFHLKADITQLGMDQRKVNVLAREVGPKLGLWKPVVVSHHMLIGLGEPRTELKDATERAIELKMSKSKPD